MNIRRDYCWKDTLREKRCSDVKWNAAAFIIIHLKSCIICLSKYIY